MNQLWDDDKIQLARLVCEMRAAMDVPVFGLAIRDVAKSMDLSEDDVYKLFDRAEYIFAKERVRLMPARDWRHKVVACMGKGEHLKSSDDDGYCNACGYQEGADDL
jgi:hypothetical protein